MLPIRQIWSAVLVGILATVAVGFSIAAEARAQDSENRPSSTAPIETDPIVSIARPSRLVPEGTFVISRRARISPAGGTGAWIVTYQNERGVATLPSMFVMPSRRLQRLESTLSVAESSERPTRRDRSVEAIVSGEVFVFQHYNFLMLTTMPRLLATTDESVKNAPQAAADSAKTESEAESKPGTEKQADTTDNNASAGVEEMIRDLESGGPIAPILQRPSSQDAPAETENERQSQSRRNSKPDASTLAEGSFIVKRAVRLVRSDSNGAWTVAFESDRDGMQEAPLVVLPCRLLEGLQSWAGRLGEAFRLNISGQVYTYQGQGYLLPTVMEIPYERDNLSP